jgi:hypothetical protein
MDDYVRWRLFTISSLVVPLLLQAIVSVVVVSFCCYCEEILRWMLLLQAHTPDSREVLMHAMNDKIEKRKRSQDSRVSMGVVMR